MKLLTLYKGEKWRTEGNRYGFKLFSRSFLEIYITLNQKDKLLAELEGEFK